MAVSAKQSKLIRGARASRVNTISKTHESLFSSAMMFLLTISVTALVLGFGLWVLQRQYTMADSVAPIVNSDDEPTATSLSKLVLTEPEDGALSRTESVVFGGTGLPSSWLIVAVNDEIHPLRTTPYGLFNTTFMLVPGVNRLSAVMVSKTGELRLKQLLQLYLPDIVIKNGEEVWIGQLRDQDTHRLTFSAWSGTSRDQLADVITDDSTVYRDGVTRSAGTISASSLKLEEFLIVIGRSLGPKQYQARLVLRTPYPETTLSRIDRAAGTPRLENLSGFRVNSFDELAHTERDHFSPVSGELGTATDISFDPYVGLITFGLRNQTEPSTTTWQRVLGIEQPAVSTPAKP